jgi:hypothetical protein
MIVYENQLCEDDKIEDKLLKKLNNKRECPTIYDLKTYLKRNGFDLKYDTIKKIIKTKLKFSWRRIKSTQEYVNTDINLLKR